MMTVKREDDRLNVALLTLLYTLQGVPMGLCQIVPLLLMVHSNPRIHNQ